jgi:hypothetical protein
MGPGPAHRDESPTYLQAEPFSEVPSTPLPSTLLRDGEQSRTVESRLHEASRPQKQILRWSLRRPPQNVAGRV